VFLIVYAIILAKVLQSYKVISIMVGNIQSKKMPLLKRGIFPNKIKHLIE